MELHPRAIFHSFDIAVLTYAKNGHHPIRHMHADNTTAPPVRLSIPSQVRHFAKVCVCWVGLVSLHRLASASKRCSQHYC